MPGVGQQRAQAGMFARRPGKQAAPSFLSQLRNQARAAAEGALDIATFGVDDQIAAGAHAIGDWFHGKSIGAAYRRRIAEQHQQDADDARTYGTARMLGTIGATGLELLLPGGAIGAAARLAGKAKFIKAGGRAAEALARLSRPLAPAKRIAEATRLSGKERAAIGVVGGAGGAAGQGVSDLVHHRRSSWRDYAGAAAGGTAEALAAIRGNPKLAAAFGGATTSMAQDVINGRAPSASEAAKSAYASAVLASLAGAAGTERAARASIKTKEGLGETGSKLRTLMNLDWTASTKKQRYDLEPIDGEFSAGYTYPDQRTASGKLIESKFGQSAHLSHRQQQAYRQLGSTYRVDHFLPRDVGSLAGFLASQPAHDAGRNRPVDLDPWAILQPFRPIQDPARFTPVFPPYLG